MNDDLAQLVKFLCAWAWAGVKLKELQISSAPAGEIEEAIHYFKALNRIKQQLDKDNRSTDCLTLADVGLAPRQLTLFSE